ncbi:hypothetical protein ILUMI_10409 [Ignelater luminosus]|uniref:Uncharacterized protein n=1 Tax=Ignelater luminosus TaxID=2038154 RepID=A0A8K0CXY2_IGNLU|nr:hypothetical protein ILUMI_10409 [Ignelater luminosus]
MENTAPKQTPEPSKNSCQSCSSKEQHEENDKNKINKKKKRVKKKSDIPQAMEIESSYSGMNKSRSSTNRGKPYSAHKLLKKGSVKSKKEVQEQSSHGSMADDERETTNTNTD